MPGNQPEWKISELSKKSLDSPRLASDSGIGFLGSFRTPQKQEQVSALQVLQGKLLPPSFSAMEGFPGWAKPVETESREEAITKDQEGSKNEEEQKFRREVEERKQEFQQKTDEIVGKEEAMRTPPNFSCPSFSEERQRLQEKREKVEEEFKTTKNMILSIEEIMKNAFHFNK